MKRLVLFVLFLSFLNAQSPLDPKNFSMPSKKELQNNKDIEDLKTNNFYLNLDESEINETLSQDRNIREAFDGFSQREINYKPVIRPIASMDTISLHPYFTFTLLLPAGSVISHIDSSVAMAVLKYENNAVLIRANADFQISNLTILYKLNNKNQVLNILANKYEKINGEKLNLLYQYENNQKLDKMQVLHTYIKEYGNYPTQKYSYIDIGGVTYRIVEDNKYGDIFLRGKLYRIDNNVIHK